MPAALAALAALVWLPAVTGGFVADDFVMLRTVEQLPGAFDAFARDDLGQSGGEGHFYRPLWVLWCAAIERTFGAAPVAFHAANLLLFSVATVQVWGLARQLVGNRGALVGAAAFALYPRHGESVAWVSGSTDLVATVLALGALLCLGAPWRPSTRLVGAAVLAAAAALAKEAAFVLPALALLLALAQPPEPERGGGRFGGAAAMAGALLVVLAVRTAVLGGTGGYGEDPLTAGNVVAALASYPLAAVTPHQLEVLRHPVLLALPLAVLLAVAVGVARRPRPVVLIGLAWFAVALVPVLGQPLDLNTATGERLLFLPSVGLALALGAVVGELRLLRSRALAAVALGLAGLLCVLGARNWHTAGELAERVSGEAAALAVDGRPLTLLSIPEGYRNAHVFGNALDLAVERAGGRRVTLRWCVPVQVREERSGAVVFRGAGGRGFTGSSGWSAPFDFPLSGGSQRGPGCAYAEAAGADGAIGLSLGAVARPEGAGRLAVFDGRDLVSLGR